MSRERILSAVRNAIRKPGVETAADALYIRAGSLSEQDRLAQFVSRLEDYNAQVYRCHEGSVSDTVARAMEARGKTALVIPTGLPAAWLPSTAQFVMDSGLTYEDLDGAEGALTACTAAISWTGTILLTHSETEGRRALTLIPDYHLCVVFTKQLFETVAEGLEALGLRRTSPVTTISGPSATADIEMTRIKGVHGPRTLDVILVS